MVTTTTWVASRWSKAKVPEIMEMQKLGMESIAKHPTLPETRLMDFLNKLWNELKETDRHTTHRPESLPLVKLNILTNGGMNDMSKSRTGEGTNTNAYMNIGTGTTAEAVTDDTTYSNSLQTQSARKTMGSKAAVNQQERYSAAFDDTDVTGEPLSITEAGINTHTTGHASQKQIARTTFTAQTLDVGITIAFQAYVNHRNGTAT